MVQITAQSQIKLDANKFEVDKFSVKFNLTNLMNEDFGQWLTSQRKKRGLNQTELAELARVSKNYISLLEAGKVTQPRMSSIDKIAKALNVKTEDARRHLVAGQVNIKPFSNERLSSIDFAYEGLKTEESRDRADYLIELLERELERIGEEEKLKLAGNDATINESGETKIHITKKDFHREG